MATDHVNCRCALYVQRVVDEPREVTLSDGTTATVRPIRWVEIGTVTSINFTPSFTPPPREE